MFTVHDEKRIIVDTTLIQSYIFSVDKPLIITFSPAGAVLTSQQVAGGANAWGYDFFKKNKINVLAFSAIDDKHWFVSQTLKTFIQELLPQLVIFPERLGYGASMGAYALSNYHSELLLDRMLLITPIPSPEISHNEQSDFNYAFGFEGQLTIILDPFCIQDRAAAKQYPVQASEMMLPGVGHQVIESLSNIGYLKKLIFQFINNEIDPLSFSNIVRKRRNIARYYRFMARNPTNKNTAKRKSIIRYYQIIWSIKNIGALSDSFCKKWKKSISKRINKLNNKLMKK